MSELTMSVERVPEHGAFLVHPTGQLTVRSRHRLRGAVLKCLAECPVAVVVDLADVEYVDRMAGVVFLALRREAAAGPGVNLLLSGASAALAQRIKSLDPGQPLYPTRGEAIQAIHDGPFVADWIYRRLPPEPESTSLAGCLVADACAAWRLSALIHPARAVMFDLIRAVHGCLADDLQVIASHRPARLVLSVRSRLTAGHRPGCVPGRLATERRAGPSPYSATYHHNVTATAHVAWASLSL